MQRIQARTTTRLFAALKRLRTWGVSTCRAPRRTLHIIAPFVKCGACQATFGRVPSRVPSACPTSTDFALRLGRLSHLDITTPPRERGQFTFESNRHVCAYSSPTSCVAKFGYETILRLLGRLEQRVRSWACKEEISRGYWGRTECQYGCENREASIAHCL